MQVSDAMQYDFTSIKLLRMQDNCHGDLPFFARRYNAAAATREIHGHEYSQINYVAKGCCRHAYGDVVHDMTEGDVFVVPPFIPHRIIVSEGAELEIIEIEFNTELVTQECTQEETGALLLDFLFLEPYLMSSEKNIRRQLNLTGKARTVMELKMMEIVNEFRDRGDGFAPMVKSLIVSLAIQLGRAYQRHSKDAPPNIVLENRHESVRKAIEHIRSNYHEKLTIEEAARIAMLSPSYFCYIFKSITNHTFTEYVNNLRIQKSIELLGTTQMNVGEICFAIGFNNISHFNRLFKQYLNMSPSAFRKRLEMPTQFALNKS